MSYYYVVKNSHNGDNVVVSKHISRRAAQNYIEEVVIDTCYLYQGLISPTYVCTSYERSGTYNLESFYYCKSYGFFVQTYNEVDIVTCWNRNRTVGFFKNTWIDEKLFTLSIVERKKGGLITPIYDGLYNITNVKGLPCRPFIMELSEKFSKLPLAFT